jgi:Casein kinase substrate phosphoprotein PP28
MTREQRRAAAKARKEALIAKKQNKPAAVGDLPPSSSSDSDSDEMPANPNHTAKSRSQAAGKAAEDASQPLSRREREAVEAAQARERYQKLHAEGKTDEARADLARLKLIREKREQDAARKQAEKEEKEAAEKKRLEEMDERERKKREAAMAPAAAGGKKKGKK